jgi:predicted nucleotidyltransferase
MMYHRIEISRERLAVFCRRNDIRRLSLFGSILRDDFRPDSDIDFLVEFEPGKTPSLMGMAGLEIELSEMLGRRVDLRTPEDLSRYFRKEVLERAVPQYVCES